MVHVASTLGNVVGQAHVGSLHMTRREIQGLSRGHREEMASTATACGTEEQGALSAAGSRSLTSVTARPESTLPS